MSTFKTIIIEDEEPARELIKSFLSKFKEIEIIAECFDGFTAVKTINELKPDLIFLDIQLPKLTGFEILELIEHKPIVVFSTAYDQYAIKAFDMSAVDYILKPYSFERFETAVKKAIEKLSSLSIKTIDEHPYQQLINKSEEIESVIDRVVVKTGTKIKVVPVEKILYIEAQDDYVMIYAEEGKMLKEKTMKYFETHLDSNTFIRIHRSYIVNVTQIAQLEHFTKDSYVAILKNGVKLKVSDSGYKNLKKRLNF